MKRMFAIAVLSGFSLAACAQPADPPAADGGTRIAVSTPQAEAPAASSYPAGSPQARVRDVLMQLNPRIELDRIAPAPFPGFHQVIAGGQVVYVSDDGRFLMQGELLDIANRKDLNEAAMASLRAEVLRTIPAKDRITYGPAGGAKHSVVVLTDTECGYCRKFHNDMAEYNKRGIQVEYMAFPRAGLGSADYRTMVSVWCSSDPNKAMTDAKNERPVPARTCKTPVDMQYRAGQRMGLTGTPMILTNDGQLIGGYVSPDQLLQRLQQLAAGKGA